MEQFIFAVSADAESERLLDDVTQQIGNLPEAANLGFVYCTDRLAEDMQAILTTLQRRYSGVHWVGTVGVGICTSGREIYDRPAIALMVGNFPDTGFRLLPKYPGTLDSWPEDLAHWWRNQDYCFSFLHGDPSDSEIPQLLTRLSETGTFSFVNGGLSSSQGRNPQVADAITNGGFSGVVFNPEVGVLTDHTQGCSPIGAVHRITKAQKNIAVSLDKRPALEVMKEDIGQVLAKDLSKIGGYIFAALPIQGSDTGDYMVRNLVGVDPEQGLVAVGDMLEDRESLMFCRRDGNTAREDMQRMLNRLHTRVGKRVIRGGVYVSCLGRGRHQFGENSEELSMIQQVLGDFPLVGFFANGEIYNGRLYGYTGVLTLFV